MCKKEKEKVGKNNAKIREKRSERSEKVHVSIKRSKICLYQEK